jgi:Divergent InlB B-repeat domain/Fibronectin type III domain
MIKGIRYSSYALCALLVASSLSFGQMAPAAKSRYPSAPVTRSPKTSDRNRRRVFEKTAPDRQQTASERKVAERAGTVNFNELAHREALASRTPEKLRFIPEPEEEEGVGDRPIPDDARIFREEGIVPSQPLGPSPIVSPSFQGATATSSFPPDTQGAAGPNHLVVTVNGRVLVQSKTGTSLGSVTLVGFFSNMSSDVFDPRVQYDPYSSRWILIADADRQSAASAILVAVSQTSDPTGNWNRSRIDVDSTNQSWADYPMLGFNKNWIVVSLNMFASPGTSTPFYSRFLVLNKASFYAGGVDYTELSAPSQNGATMAPASTYDPNLATMYVLQNWNGNSGGSGFLRLYSITGGIGSEVLNSGIFISTPNPWGFEPSGAVDFAPQLGTSNKIHTNDSSMQSVVYRNGSLWCAHTIFLPAGTPTRSSVQWWQISPTGPSIQQRGRIDDASGNTFYAFPSIAVNSNNDVLIGYSRFSSAQYAGGAYSYRAGTDAVNSLRDDAVLKTGAGTYFVSFGGRNRWGDYSGTSVDPANDTDLWTLQEYAASTDIWATWWGRIGSSPITGPVNDNFANGQVITDNSGSVTGTSINATKEAGEPNHAGNAGGASVWYNWQVPSSGTATITTTGSNFDTLLGVYTGSSVDALTFVAGNDDDPGGGLASRVSFSAAMGTTYRIAVDGFRSSSGSVASGDINLNWSLSGPPPAPAANAATSVTSSGFTANWSSSSGATGYRIDVSPNSSFSSFVSGFQDLDVGNVLSRSVSGLSAGTTYFYRLRAYNGSGTSGNSGTISVTTTAPSFTITVTASPSAGGTVSGAGTFSSGSSRTVNATANSGYTFTNWTESGSVVSTSAGYTFTLNSNRNLVANFTPIIVARAATAGLYNPATSTFFLRNSNSAGSANITFAYGPAGVGWIPVVGDWDGNGTVTVGLYNPTNSTFFLKNTNVGGSADLTFSYGPAGAGWIPVVGDWDGNGTDTVGLYNPSTSTFFLKNTNASGAADLVFSYGPAGSGWTPLAGDWNNDGSDTVGLYQPSGSTFFLKNTNSAGSANLVFSYGPAGAGWAPISGDWDQDGIRTVGLYNPATSTFFLRNTNGAGPADLTFSYGPAGAGWKSLAGDWDGL